MNERDPDRVTRAGMRDRSMTGGGGLYTALAIAALLVLGYVLFWPTSERTTSLTDSTRIERPTTPTIPPANRPQTDLPTTTPPPAKTPAQ